MLDNAEHGLGLIRNQSAIAGRVVWPEAKHDDGRPRPLLLDHGGISFRADQRIGTERHQNGAANAVEIRFCSEGSVPCAQRLLLDYGRNAFRQNCSHRVLVGARDGDNRVGANCAHTVQHMPYQGTMGNLVKDFKCLGLHPGAKTSGKDDSSDRVVHGALFSFRSHSVCSVNTGERESQFVTLSIKRDGAAGSDA